ncbi:hypothetical protein BGAL_0255g00150 [Botrytis galanthina]|uniref:Uncharacterized protein n=1 Tax=Botrytis galanthina TaxID=278940 RepID=A0A4S8R2L5_9HELO|nr:hypothetical protein BGAL_0255g00150 [Botrytis galanthina]
MTPSYMMQMHLNKDVFTVVDRDASLHIESFPTLENEISMSGGQIRSWYLEAWTVVGQLKRGAVRGKSDWWGRREGQRGIRYVGWCQVGAKERTGQNVLEDTIHTKDLEFTLPCDS